MTSKYELSISTEYVEHWGLNEALRELFQNAIDEGDYEYEYSNNTLRIINHGASLDRSTLLLGVSSKRDDGSKIGTYGEGYKIATLVLLREGHDVTIYNNSENEIWETSLVNSRKFHKRIPVFYVSNNKSSDDDLVIEVTDISETEWEDYKAYNLNLRDPGEIFTGDDGSILFDDSEKGNIYVEGLFVCNNDSLKYGINFNANSVSLNRDRNMISNFDLLWEFSKLISQYLKSKSAEEQFEFYNENHCYNIYSSVVDTSIKKNLKTEFLERYGDRAYPVVSSESDDVLNQLKKYGYVPVVTTKTIVDLISEYFDDSARIPIGDTLYEYLTNLKDKISSCNSSEIEELMEEYLEIIEEHKLELLDITL